MLTVDVGTGIIEAEGMPSRKGEIIDFINTIAGEGHYYVEYVKFVDRYRKELAEAYQKEGSWDKVLSTVATEDPQAKLVVVEMIEKELGRSVESPEELGSVAKIVEHADYLEELFWSARECAYSSAIAKGLDGGMSLEELRSIEPKDYGLPERWKTFSRLTAIDGRSEATKDSIIRYEVVMGCGLEEVSPYVSKTVDIRSLANELKAPYSEIFSMYEWAQELHNLYKGE